ncbi:MAG: ribosomal protection-like ABC-F family protein [Gaiellaceae bacterium]
MIQIGAKEITKSYGSRQILRGLDFEIEEGARIGVVGPNGCGKSTLLRIVAGLEEPDEGQVARRRDLVVAHLPQQVPGDELSALDSALAAQPDIVEVEHELAEVVERLGRPNAAADMKLLERLLHRQEQLLERYTAIGGPSLEGRARAWLRELGLEEHELHLATRALSVGQRKLVALAACLALDPDVLILDEPETHLDAVRRSALETLIRSFDGAIVAVSHDRYLLDETVSSIAELADGRVRIWPGNYSAYVAQRELELERQRVLYVTQQKEIARLEEAIARFKLWASWVPDERNIRQARTKQRQIDSMDKVDRPVLERRRIALRLRPKLRGGERIFDVRSVGVAFGDHPVLVDASLTVLRGERVGVVGENGAGKSVLLTVLAGLQEPSEGELWTGPSIRVGYLPQTPERSFAKETPLEIVRGNHPCSEGEAVSLLMKFLFAYEQVRRPVSTLSGGELTRLHLLLLMLGGANCLLLDEPTNHLDIDSVEMLEAALEEFAGTAIFTSHDRYFLDRIADRIIEVADGEVRDFEGGYSAWFERRSSIATA